VSDGKRLPFGWGVFALKNEGDEATIVWPEGTEARLAVGGRASACAPRSTLWACYLGEPETGSECAGSAGIAAALALGARNGWLPRGSMVAARRAWKGLLAHLTPDGFLGGASQGNCCGEAFQRSGYRVIYPMAMGLLLQLEAALA